MQKVRATSTRLVKMLIASVRYFKTQSGLVIRNPSITHKAKRLFCYDGTHLNQLGNSVLLLLNVLQGEGGLKPSCCPNLGCQCFLMIGKSSSLNNLQFFTGGGGGVTFITSLLWRVSLYRQAHLAESGDFHERGFLSFLAQNSGYSSSSTGGDIGSLVHWVYLENRPDPCYIWGLPLGALAPLGTRGGRK